MSGAKTATRRFYSDRQIRTWQNAYDKDPNRIHDAWDKVPFAGGKYIGSFRLTRRPYLQPLCEMTAADLHKEGALVCHECKMEPGLFPLFVGKDPSAVALVIEFEKVSSP